MCVCVCASVQVCNLLLVSTQHGLVEGRHNVLLAFLDLRGLGQWLGKLLDPFGAIRALELHVEMIDWRQGDEGTQNVLDASTLLEQSIAHVGATLH